MIVTGYLRGFRAAAFIAVSFASIATLLCCFVAELFLHVKEVSVWTVWWKIALMAFLLERVIMLLVAAAFIRLAIGYQRHFNVTFAEAEEAAIIVPRVVPPECSTEEFVLELGQARMNRGAGPIEI